MHAIPVNGPNEGVTNSKMGLRSSHSILRDSNALPHNNYVVKIITEKNRISFLTHAQSLLKTKQSKPKGSSLALAKDEINNNHQRIKIINHHLLVPQFITSETPRGVDDGDP